MSEMQVCPGLRRVLPRPFWPLYQQQPSMTQQLLEIQIYGFRRMLQAVAIDVYHDPRRTRVVVYQGIRGASRVLPGARAYHGLSKRRFATADLAAEPENRPGWKLGPKPGRKVLELCKGEGFGPRHWPSAADGALRRRVVRDPRGPRRTGSASARSSKI